MSTNFRSTAHNRLPAVLYFGNDWFTENRTSSHHVARCLSSHFRVYYIECPGLRPPRANARDLRKTLRKLAGVFRRPRVVADRLQISTLVQLPWRHPAAITWINGLATVLFVRCMMWSQGIRRPIVWCTVPHVSHLLGKLGEQLSVYYCIDDYAALPGVDADAVGAMDDEMTRKADVVFVASETLREKKARANPNTHVSPHGVDAAHFGAAQEAGVRSPADVDALPRPIVGFFGLIERWIDLELVSFLADRRPQWSFLMIGRVAIPDQDLPRQPNVYFVGPRPYASLPAYGGSFDAAIIPYRPTQQVFHSNSLKLREYLAMGKPIVSVRTPQISQFSDVVEIADSRQEFLDLLDRVLTAGVSPRDVRRRMLRVANDTWEARLDRVLDVVRETVTLRDAAASRQSDPAPAAR